jgi:hypothetical protein
MYEKWVALLRNRQVRAHIVAHTSDALVRSLLHLLQVNCQYSTSE